ncbi:vicilin Cor a 11.0101-like [Apium graveolens]|uniref:vicilin Cor a 11.0101-like n=1 Tax=Apium graveolens TaxID=4045 RepID=UPI003D7A46CF
MKPFAFVLIFSVLFVSNTCSEVAQKKDPELLQCFHLCRQQQAYSESEKSECREMCRQYIKEKHRRGGACDTKVGETEKEGDEYPYVFEEKHFTSVVKSALGEIQLLQKFNHSLLKAIENFRLTVLVANPRAFFVPVHWDADSVIFVAHGKGTISLVRSEKRESLNVRCGDILRIPSGTTVYLINRDNNEKLVIIKLLQPVFTPGVAETFFGVGKESFFKAFSDELLQAAFKTESSRLHKMFEGSGEPIIEASEEQIRALSDHEEGGIWPFSESKGTINLFEQKPVKSNDYGELREVSPKEHRQLEDIDIGLAFINITKGGMENPFFNSKSINIGVVNKGEGYFEMACPHLSSGSSSRGTPISYRNVNAHVKRGSVYIVPPGHPVITVASKDQNLELLVFQINARDNKRFPLAGKNNIWKQIEKEAKELAFGSPWREVDEVVGKEDEDWFMKGPSQIHQEKQGGGAYIRMKTE